MKTFKLIFGVAMLTFFLAGMFSCSQFTTASLCPTYNHSKPIQHARGFNPRKPATYAEYRAKYDGDRIFKGY
jgi:hypothetical protein